MGNQGGVDVHSRKSNNLKTEVPTAYLELVFFLFAY